MWSFHIPWRVIVFPLGVPYLNLFGVNILVLAAHRKGAIGRSRAEQPERTHLTMLGTHIPGIEGGEGDEIQEDHTFILPKHVRPRTFLQTRPRSGRIFKG